MTARHETDRRLFASNGQVAHASLRGRIDGVRFVDGQRMRVASPLLDLRRSPSGERDRQLLHGSSFLVLDEDGPGGTVFGLAEADGYVGYVVRDGLSEIRSPSHRVWSLGAQLYPEPDIKTEPILNVPFLSVFEACRESNSFVEIVDGGHVPKGQLKTLSEHATDPVSVAEMLIGTPYLWGGDSNWGMDCSALVQSSLAASGVAVPRDSDQQERAIGRVLASDDRLQRGDLVFWKGHVGMMVDSRSLIHANAHHMAVQVEPLAEAEARILESGGGAVTCRRRL